MTKLNELNKLNSEKLGAPEEKTILAALNNSTMAYGGAGDAKTNAEALAQLATVFHKGGGGGGGETVVEVGPFTFDLSKPYTTSETVGEVLGMNPALNSYLTKVDFAKHPFAIQDYSCGYFLFAGSLIENYTDAGLTLPSTLNVNMPAFSDCKNLKTVEIKQVSTIDSNSAGVGTMFKGCESLETIDLSGVYYTPTDNSNYITNTFSGCTKLKSINMPNVSFEMLGYNAAISGTTFAGCSSLTSLTLKDTTMFTNLREFQDEDEALRTFQGAPFDHDTAMFIINHLYDYKAGFGSEAKLYFSTTTCSYLTDDEKAVAAGKGWIVTECAGL